MLRIARAHMKGQLRDWLEIDRLVGRLAADRIRRRRPELSFVAFLGLDKASHATGHASPDAYEALRVLDDTVAELRHDAERAGRWEETRLWVVSDHGHSRVLAHDDIALAIGEAGYRVIAHPWVFAPRPEVAVMVSGNAMAHVYLELRRRARPWWPELRARWEPLVASLLARPSVDIVLLPHSPTCCEVRARGRGAAMVEHEHGRYAYRMLSGDPLGLGAEYEGLDARDAHRVTIETDYPDSLVQIAHLAGSSRAGEIILSASREWDFRAKYEPIPHVSTHGALHREHMLVPLLTNQVLPRTPMRTADVMPSALRALGLPVPRGLDGVEFN
jgi:hypothetical protein